MILNQEIIGFCKKKLDIFTIVKKKIKITLNFIIVGINKIDTIFLKEIIKNFPSLKLKGEFFMVF